MGKGGQTRQRILEAALDRFCSQGYDATSVADIASAVRIKPAAIYYHFAGKAAVLEALVEPLADAIDELIAGAPGVDSTAESRRILLSAYLDLLIEWRPTVCFLIDDPAVRHHPDVGMRLQRQQGRLQALLAGEGARPDASVAAAAALGALWRPVTALDEDQLAGHRDTVVDAAVRALGVALP